MTDKQRFMIYIKLGYLAARVRETSGAGLSESIKILLDKGIIHELEDLETGYYLESGAYLAESFGIKPQII